MRGSFLTQPSLQRAHTQTSTHGEGEKQMDRQTKKDINQAAGDEPFCPDNSKISVKYRCCIGPVTPVSSMKQRQKQGLKDKSGEELRN